MKEHILLISFSIALLLINSNLNSQTVQNDSLTNSLQKGKFSLQFGIGANLTLQSFNNYSISAKYNISRKSGLRLGFGGNYSYNSGTSVDNNSVTQPNHSYSFSFTSELLFLYYFNPESKVNLFVGAGPTYTIEHSDSENPYYDNYIDYETIDNHQGGLKMLVGAEWFFLTKMSLFAEYEGTFTSGNSSDKRKSYNTNTGEVNRYSTSGYATILKANVARFGVSIYF